MKSVVGSQQNRSSAASILLGGSGRGPSLQDHRNIKDGVYVSESSPLLQCIDEPAQQRSPRVAAFLRAVEQICATYSKTTTATRTGWYQHEFRALCEAAVPVAGELASRSMFDVHSTITPVGVPTFLECVAAHVSMMTKEKVNKLQFVAKMVASSHAAPSSRATAGTPITDTTTPRGRPSALDFPTAPTASLLSLDIGKKRLRDEGSIEDVFGQERLSQPPAGAGRTNVRSTSPPPDAGTTDAGDSEVPTVPAAVTDKQRPISADKLNVIMPWTIPAPYKEGVMLRRANPKYFKAGKGAADAAGAGCPTVQDLIDAATTPDIYDMWLRREAALATLTPSEKPAHSNTAASGTPAPIFPHVAAQRNGMSGGPSGIGGDANGARHVTVRRSLLVGLAHFGVVRLHYGTST
jgi:hypothetical protein